MHIPYYTFPKVHSTDLVGHHLFGRTLRLQLALWIANLSPGGHLQFAGQPSFHQTEAARALNRQSNEVADDLERFVQLGMLEKHPRARGNAPQFYTRLDCDLWQVIRLVDQLLGRSANAGVA